MSGRVRVAVVGATGYAGVQAIQLVQQHPGLELVAAVSHSQAGSSLGQSYPHLQNAPELVDEAQLREIGPDAVLAALPHGESGSRAQGWLELGARVIDLGADFRLSAEEYQRWYGASHPAPQLLAQTVPGFTELYADQLAGAQLVAVPGCFSTAAVLALAPAAAAGLLADASVIVDAKTGVSGAGRGASLGTHFSEVNESLVAYKVDGHRHLPEVVNEVTRLAGPAGPAGHTVPAPAPPRITFVPHLAPMTRGILATCYFPHLGDPAPLNALYADFYRGQPFVQLQATPPATKQASGSNMVYISVAQQGEMAVVTCALDNLVKGAAGQGLECLNLAFGLDRTAGLTPPPRWP